MLIIKSCIFEVLYFVLPFTRQSFVGKSIWLARVWLILPGKPDNKYLVTSSIFRLSFQTWSMKYFNNFQKHFIEILASAVSDFYIWKSYSKWQILCIFKYLWAHLTKMTDSESYCKERHHFFNYIQFFSDGEINSSF